MHGAWADSWSTGCVTAYRTTAKFLENSLYTTKWRFKFALRFLLDDKRLDFQGGFAYPLVREGGSTSNHATPGSWESRFPSRSILEPPKLCLICVLLRYNRALQHQLQHLNNIFVCYKKKLKTFTFFDTHKEFFNTF